MGNPFEGKNTLWVVHIANHDGIAIRARNEGFVCIGWTAMGDLSSFDTREKMRRRMEDAFQSWKPRTVSSSYGQTFRFAHVIRDNDPLIYPIKRTGEIAIGQVSGPYRFADDDAELRDNDYCNVRRVKWLKIVPRTAFSQPALHSFGSFLSVSTSNDHLEEVIQVLSGVEAETGVLVDEPGDEAEDVGVDLFEVATQETADHLLKAWHRSGAHFEEVVAATLESMGYTARVTPASGDHGVDVIAHPDPLGLKQPYVKVQVKSGTSRIGEPDVNQLKGSLNTGEHGILVSLGGFTSGALAIERASPNLILIDAQRFVQLFSDHYEDLDPAWRSRYPLRQVLVPFVIR